MVRAYFLQNFKGRKSWSLKARATLRRCQFSFLRQSFYWGHKRFHRWFILRKEVRQGYSREFCAIITAHSLDPFIKLEFQHRTKINCLFTILLSIFQQIDLYSMIIVIYNAQKIISTTKRTSMIWLLRITYQWKRSLCLPWAGIRLLYPWFLLLRKSDKYELVECWRMKDLGWTS